MTADTEYTRRSYAFRALHHGPPILVVPNAWDAVSARLFEIAGFSCVGTTSAGIAWSLGYVDGETIPRDEMLAAVAHITRVTKVPVTADIEAGYGRSPREVAETVRLAVAAGAVGINLEDAGGDDHGGPLIELSLQCERIAAAREAADMGVGSGAGAVVNARTDVFWSAVGPEDTRLARALERVQAFGAAGADCAFVPRVHDRDVIKELVNGAGVPLNVLASPGVPDISALAALGVARVSVGSGIARAAAAAIRHAATELSEGCFHEFLSNAASYADMETLFSSLAVSRPE